MEPLVSPSRFGRFRSHIITSIVWVSSPRPEAYRMEGLHWSPSTRIVPRRHDAPSSSSPLGAKLSVKWLLGEPLSCPSHRGLLAGSPIHTVSVPGPTPARKASPTNGWRLLASSSAVWLPRLRSALAIGRSRPGQRAPFWALVVAG